MENGSKVGKIDSESQWKHQGRVRAFPDFDSALDGLHGAWLAGAAEWSKRVEGVERGRGSGED